MTTTTSSLTRRPPSASRPVNAIVAADGILVPTDADCDSINGIVQLSDTVRNVKKYCGVNPEILGIVFTKFDPRQNNSKTMLELAMRVADMLHTKVFQTFIRGRCRGTRGQEQFQGPGCEPS